MKSRILTVSLLLMLVVAMLAFSAYAQTDDPATTGKNAPLDFATSTTQVCPSCGSSKTWQPLPQITANTILEEGHYYVPAEGVSNTGYYTFRSGAKAQVCIHLNGSSLTSTTRVFGPSNNCTLRIFGSGTVTGNTKKSVNDGSLMYLSTAKVYLYGGSYSVDAGVPFWLEGSQASYSNLYMYNGATISGGNASGQKTGGNIHIALGRFYMYGGTVSGGTAETGGNIRINGGTLSLSGGTVSGGTATDGGNIYASGGTVTLSGCTVTGGSATQGGNLNVRTGSKTTISNGTISDGKAKYGANIYVYGSGECTVSGGTVTGGVNTNEGSGGNFYVSSDTGKLNIAGGTVSDGKSLNKGGNIMINGAGTLTVTGGVISGGTALHGGNIYTNGGTVTISDDGDSATALPQIQGGTASTGNGGSVYIGGSLKVTAGSITGGKSTKGYGGNIYAVGNVELSNCTIANGAADAGDGGNIALAGASSTAKLTATFGEGALIKDGSALNGGNMSISNATLEFAGATLSGGKVTKNGGSVIVGSAGRLNLKSGTITGGESALNGGNIYTSATNTVVNMTGGTVSDGVSRNSSTSNGGGNFYVNNGYLYVYGGVISGGKAPNAYGGNIYARAGIYKAENYVLLNDDGDPETPKPLVTGGQSKNTGGNIYIEKNFILGDCEVTNGDSSSYNYGDDISMKHGGKLTVKANFAGNCDLCMPSCCMPLVRIGGKVDETAGAAEGPFPGRLILEQYANAPILAGKDGDTGLYVAESALVHEDGTYSWFLDNASMMAAYDDSVAYIRACEGEMVLNGGNYVVDLLGKNVHFTGSGNVTCFDSANDSFETYGTATFDGVTLLNTVTTEYADNTYMTLCENNTYSFHRFTVRLTSVSLRPSAGGIYYTAKWEGDSALKTVVESFGVAVSVKDAPGADFETDGHSLFSRFDGSKFECGVKKTGILVTGILKDTSDLRQSLNSKYAQMKIHATAYLTIGETNYMSASMAYSLKDVIEMIHDNRNVYADDVQTMQDFMATWRAKGLEDAFWGDYTFDVAEDVYHLEALYADRVAYHGEFHDHADTGGTSDGKVQLSKVKEAMSLRGIDFTTILDHHQILHMELEEWDNSMFIGGSEFGTIISGTNATGKSKHVNMIFADPADFVALMEKQTRFKWAQDENGEYHYEAIRFSADQFRQLIQDIKDCGGMYVFPHPKDGTRYISDDPLDYWFADEVGLEVFYGPSYYAPTHDRTKNAYKLWVDLLKAGKRIWATAGSDSHSLPNTNALTTIYSERKDAATYLSHARVGDTTCGPVGIRMAVGDTLTGGQTSFAGKRLVFCVDDIHESVDRSMTYEVRLIQGKDGQETTVYTEILDTTKPLYYYMDADNNSSYYRVEIYDLSRDILLALGNPIWNVQEG